MKLQLSKLGYWLNPQTNVWTKPYFSGIPYSDGDEVEEGIANIVAHAGDIGILSTELREHCIDWPSLYHLSGTRANILRPFQSIFNNADVLEIGAGCGAITRYLGECGANVLAVEGAPRRAGIARSRTRDLANVTVVSDRFDDFKWIGQFDVITLIGVLEYANLFTVGDSPALAMLQRARAMLKPGGKIIIAIENQLGLKYFAGAPEDHVGQAMYGIEGRYEKDQPKTFGKKMLADLLKEAGFASSAFLAPFPDYKLPISIITEEGINNSAFDPAVFAWQSARRDPQLPAFCDFSPELVWPEIFQNGLGLDFSNSFLIAASPLKESGSGKQELAYHYSTDRLPQYCKETIFWSDDEKTIKVRYRPLAKGFESNEPNQILRCEWPTEAAYIKGKPLSWEFVQIVSRDGWLVEDVGTFIKRYVALLSKIAEQNGDLVLLTHPQINLSGEFFDIVPQNIIIDNDGLPIVIDQEWKLTETIGLGRLLFRSLLLMIGTITRFGRSATGQQYSKGEFILAVLDAANYPLAEQDLSRYLKEEALIQQNVTGLSVLEILNKWPSQFLPQHNLRQIAVEREWHIAHLEQVVGERDGRIANLTQTVVEKGGHITHLEQVVGERDGYIANLTQTMAEQAGHIAHLEQVVGEQDGQIATLKKVSSEHEGHIAMLNQKMTGLHNKIAELYNSNSWRITKPLRLVSHLIKGQQELSQLPKDFNPDQYLKLNPDLAAAGIDLATHYRLYGRREGRVYSLPKEFYVDHKFNVDRETILVVSHEASRTGAPILSLNIAQAFVGQYNVVVLLLADGPLADAFRQAGAAVMSSPVLKGNPVLVGLFVALLHERYKFKFALVNSIESRITLPALANCYVPSISLLHEFAAYTRPRNAFRDALFWSGDVVFSANLTLENALAEYPDLGGRSVHVHPQGRCLVPLDANSEHQMQVENERIRRLVRPINSPKSSVVVLGAGGVQLRKGVDLFIECAGRVIATPEGSGFRFVWIGKGYDPDNDVGYSVYLADQISRAGLQEHVFFIDETNAIEAAYKEADLLLLSSRLDPLPNVAIDALVHGLPVLCFNKTTGIADFLIDCGLGEHCVAEYLDSSDMSKKILALASSKQLYKKVAAQSLKASTAYFSMKNYVERLDVLAKAVIVHSLQEKADAEVILSSGLFRGDFYCPPHAQGQTIEMEVRGYIRAWATGIGRRKPFPGFHPGIYIEQHGTAAPDIDPFADYLRAGQPQGMWNYPVVTSAVKRLPMRSQRVALHLHIYYPELLTEITERLFLNRLCPDLFISINNEEARNSVVSQLNNYKGKVVDVQLVPNVGRDIAPLLTVFGQLLIDNYDFIGHIHTKKSIDIKDAEVGLSWYRFLLENLLGGETAGAMADEILAYMQDDQSIGMVFPDEPNIIGWSANREIAEPLSTRLGLKKLPEHFVFPVGTMFWIKASALAPMVKLKLNWDDYPKEPLPYDGTLLHAVERLFPLAMSLTDLHCAVTNTKGLTR